MIHIEDNYIREHLINGHFGLEKESLRVLESGYFSHTQHPFAEDETRIVKDFCENQAEINTGVHASVTGAMDELKQLHTMLEKGVSSLPEREYIWPFSNPPFIRDEEDIPVAEFDGMLRAKTVYRDYLSDKYGRYKMTFSGIHVNFSFDEKLLKKDFELSGSDSYKEHKNRIYLELAEGLVEFGWILTLLTAASPVTDSSFLKKGEVGNTCFSGKASLRCSESGYWNNFVPVLDYENIYAYVSSIKKYIKGGWLNSPSELYYPIRLKSEGENNLETLLKNGVDHIELRMFDLNPLIPYGLDERDVVFAHLLMIWLATREFCGLNDKDQIRCAVNFKRAAGYDIDLAKYLIKDGRAVSMRDAGVIILNKMKTFFKDYPDYAEKVLDFQLEKLQNDEKRYAYMVKKTYGEDFVKKGMELAKNNNHSLTK